MVKIERQRNPSLEQLQQAQQQHRMVAETPQIPPFDQGNLSAVSDILEKIASMENRRLKAKLAGDRDRMADIRASQQKLKRSDGALMLRKFEMTRWTRVLLGAAAQGLVISLLLSLMVLAFTGGWTWSPLTFLIMPILWVVMIWNLSPPVFGTTGSPKRARRLAKALGKRTQTAGVYALVAKPWLTAVVLWRMPKQLWNTYRAKKKAAG